LHKLVKKCKLNYAQIISADMTEWTCSFTWQIDYLPNFIKIWREAA